MIVSRTHHLILLLGETPAVGRGLILQVAPRDAHLFVRRHREECLAGTVGIEGACRLCLGRFIDISIAFVNFLAARKQHCAQGECEESPVDFR